jgi:hypothetical protein
VKRVLALIAGGLGIRALLRRRRRPAVEPPVDELRARLADSKAAASEPADDEVADVAPGIDERRAGVHERARKAIDELGSD